MTTPSIFTVRGILTWFIAGFLAVLVFHQGVLAILHTIGVTPYAPLQMQPVPPLGVPQVISLAFWGGLWGLVLGLIAPRLPRGIAYWLIIAGFGAVAPVLVAIFVVFPLKGIEPSGDPIAGLITGLLINGAWAVGTALFARIGGRIR